jgi:endonuclease YncB( thermonuclease family)
MDVEGLMGKPNWYKPYRRRSLYRRWRPWLFGWKSIFPLAVLITVGQFYSEGAVTWPDSLMRKADGYVRSIFQEPLPPEKNTFNPSIIQASTELPKTLVEEANEEAVAPTPDIPKRAVEHRVKRIVDGDTVYLGDGTKVRLHGIDTPERDQPYGKQATRNLDKLIGRTVFVVERDTDRYGRLVGTLYTPEGVNVNLEMVCNGSAWWYSRYAKNNRAMASCQDDAKEAGLGLWADDDPMPPWEWRRL